MGLLKALETGKMQGLSLDGATPTSYNTTDPNHAKNKNGLKENAGLDPVGLNSQLDLGSEPEKYVDNQPG